MANQVEKQRAAGERGTNQNQSLAKRGEGNEQARMVPYGGMFSPFSLMRRFTEDVDRLFSSFGLGDFGPPTRAVASTGTSMTSWMPSVEVTTRGDDLVI